MSSINYLIIDLFIWGLSAGPATTILQASILLHRGDSLQTKSGCDSSPGHILLYQPSDPSPEQLLCVALICSS